MAQFNLGQRHQFGQGTPTNLAMAYQWFNLAAKQGIPDAAKACEEIKVALSPEQVAESERAVAEFMPKKASGPATP